MGNKTLFNKIWSVIYAPLIFFIVQSVMTIVCAVVFSLIAGSEISAAFKMKEGSESLINKNMLWILFSSAVVSLLIFYTFYKKGNLPNKENVIKFKRIYLLILCLIGFLGNVLATSLIELFDLTRIFTQYEDSYLSIVGKNVLIEVVVLGILMPIVEELIFRGIVFNNLRKYTSIIWASLLQALIFSIYHMNPLQSIYVFFFAILLSYSYIKLKTLWAPIIIHIAYNMTSISMSRALSPNFLSEKALAITLLGSIAFIIIFLVFQKLVKKEDFKTGDVSI